MSRPGDDLILAGGRQIDKIVGNTRNPNRQIGILPGTFSRGARNGVVDDVDLSLGAAAGKVSSD